MDLGFGLVEVSGPEGALESGCFSTLRTLFPLLLVLDLLQAPSELRLPFCPSTFSLCLCIPIF